MSCVWSHIVTHLHCNNRVVQDQINAGLKPYQEWTRSGQQSQLVELQVGVAVWVWVCGEQHQQLHVCAGMLLCACV